MNNPHQVAILHQLDLNALTTTNKHVPFTFRWGPLTGSGTFELSPNGLYPTKDRYKL